MKFSVIAYDLPFNDKLPFVLNGPYEDCARRASEFGFQAIELQIENPLDYDFSSVRRSLDRYGISASAVTTGLSYTYEGHNMSSRDAAVRAKTVERLKRQLDFAKALDSQILLGFIRGRMARGETEQEHEELLSDSMYRILEYAEQIGSRICFEQINHNDGDIYMTTARTLRFINKFNSPRLFYNADTYHMMMEERDVAGAIRLAGNKMTLFHVSGKNRLRPDQKDFDFKTAGETLRETGYENWVTLEYRPLPSQNAAVGYGIRFLRRYFGEGCGTTL